MEKTEYFPISSREDSEDALCVASHHASLWRRRFFMTLALSTLVILLLLGVIVDGIQSPRRCSSHMANVVIPYSPAPVRYVNRWLMKDPESSRFSGEPRPELDQAWHEMLDGTLIRLSEDELLQANNATSVRSKDGGYIGSIGVSHSLHCLKRIKQYMYPDYYYTDNATDWEEVHEHMDHCLESLRQELLCSADLNLWTFQWTPHSRVKPANHIPQQHACVDWDALHSWMQNRAITWDDMVTPPDVSYTESDSTEPKGD